MIITRLGLFCYNNPMISIRRFLPYLAPVLLALLAFYPALTNGGLPAGADVTIHYWRTFDLEHSWGRGELFPRWSEIFYYGYGSPAPGYTAGAAYVVAVIAGLIPGVDDVARIKAVWLLGLLLGSVGMFAFARQRWGDPAALLCAASFIFAPATIFQEPIARASFGVTLGVGAFAASLASLDRIARGERGVIQRFIAVIGLALLLLSHNLTAITGAAILAAWGLWLALFRRAAYPRLWEAALIFVLSGALCAAFWLPVLLTRDQVSLDRMAQDENLDYRLRFEPLGALLAPPVGFDESTFNPPQKRSLGVASRITAVIGIVVLLIRRALKSTQRTMRALSLQNAFAVESLFWLIIALLCVFLATPYARPLWDASPFLQTFLFPARFLNFAAPALALTAAPFFAWIGGNLTQKHRGTDAEYNTAAPDLNRGIKPLVLNSFVPLRLCVFVLMLFAFVFQGLSSTAWGWSAFPAQATLAAYFDHELTTGILGGTSANEFLPASAAQVPPPTGFVMDSLTAGQVAQRFNPYIMPSGTTLQALADSPTHYALHIDAPQDFTIELLHLYFPGWQAALDGVPVVAAPSVPFGFTTVQIPAGAHTLTLDYPLTTVQSVGWGISVLAGVTLIGMIFLTQRHRGTKGQREEIQSQSGESVAGLLVVVGLAFVVVWVLYRTGIVWQASPPGEAYLASTPVQIDFADAGVTLLGYDFAQPQPDALWTLALYWHLPPDTPRDLNTFVHLLDATGNIVAQHDKFATSNVLDAPGWRDEMHYRDEYRLTLDAPLPAGEYRLRIGWWRCVQGDPAACAERADLGVMTLDQVITVR